ncbi:hypothetical protein FEM48_Zijuj10G0061300 [Ziziphus jujuba var. spinosa]|uniref:Uncharacterized protein n=1 Tax=Ziziphus jujuba var. spinosa TaxID=714518 RepID=A0A978ULR7_ZIZJJ|nr:hypothetical protein FEM48_Zijuj10G0061300 [Ziziphus jujuba var. spinosa]
MGNCQAIDAAALVIQHPSGKIERLYWNISASEVMRLNPGHYVSLIIPLPLSENEEENNKNNNNNNYEQKTVRFTRVKLLRPNETLTLGHAYRLVTTQEVMKVLRAKKYAKSKKQQQETVEKSETTASSEKQLSSKCEEEEGKSEKKTYQASKHERQRPRMTPANATVTRSKSWRPSLQSISEAAS